MILNNEIYRMRRNLLAAADVWAASDCVCSRWEFEFWMPVWAPTKAEADSAGNLCVTSERICRVKICVLASVFSGRSAWCPEEVPHGITAQDRESEKRLSLHGIAIKIIYMKYRARESSSLTILLTILLVCMVWAKAGRHSIAPQRCSRQVDIRLHVYVHCMLDKIKRGLCR